MTVCLGELLSGGHVREHKHEEGLQHLYTQLSRKMGATGEFVAVYETQRAILMDLQNQKVETISWLA
jgi:hypothetical protein